MKKFMRNDLASTEVFEHVKAYLGEHLPEYELLWVVRYSDYEGDRNRYMVAAKCLNTKYGQYYAAWTCWNEKTRGLDFGHYMLKSEEACMDVMTEFYREMPKRYVFKVRETLEKTYLVEASNYEEARDRIEDAAFYTDEITLDCGDYVGKEVLCIDKYGDEPVPDDADLEKYVDGILKANEN